MKTIIYEPTKEEKKDMENRSLKIIEIMKGLDIVQTNMVLNILLTSFEETYGIQFSAIKYKDEKDR